MLHGTLKEHGRSNHKIFVGKRYGDHDNHYNNNYNCNISLIEYT